MALTTNVTLSVRSTLTKTSTLSTPTDDEQLWVNDVMTDIDPIKVAGKSLSQTRTVLPYSIDNIDLTGQIKDNLGQTFNLTKCKAIIIKNKSNSVGNLLSIGGGSVYVSSSLDTLDYAQVTIGGNGIFMLWNPIDGYNVSNSSGEIWIQNLSSSAISYDIIVVGL